MYSDESLVSLFSDGNEAAFAVLYDRFYKRVLLFARRYVSEPDAQDITAESFVQLWRKKNQFSHLKSISSFLFVTARNRCFDIIRHQQVKNKHEAELIELMSDNRHTDFFVEQVRLELVKLVNQAIGKLPERMREVFVLSYNEGLKPAEIAEKLNISVKTVSNQKLSAVKLLKAALEQHPLDIVLFLVICSLQ